MSTKKHIEAGDTLTVGDLTDAHLGAVIEVGPVSEITSRLRLDRLVHYDADIVTMWTAAGGTYPAYRHETVTVITPPPVVQPDEPKTLGQCITLEGLPGWVGSLLDPGGGEPFLCRMIDGATFWTDWAGVCDVARARRIIVSDPPRWPDEAPEADETPVVPERIEEGEWPNDDTHLRAWEWIETDGFPWRWDAKVDRWQSEYMTSDMRHPLFGPWTRGERVG